MLLYSGLQFTITNEVRKKTSVGGYLFQNFSYREAMCFLSQVIRRRKFSYPYSIKKAALWAAFQI
jgi:hypothetical protein